MCPIVLLAAILFSVTACRTTDTGISTESQFSTVEFASAEPPTSVKNCIQNRMMGGADARSLAECGFIAWGQIPGPWKLSSPEATTYEFGFGHPFSHEPVLFRCGDRLRYFERNGVVVRCGNKTRPRFFVSEGAGPASAGSEAAKAIAAYAESLPPSSSQELYLIGEGTCGLNVELWLRPLQSTGPLERVQLTMVGERREPPWSLFVMVASPKCLRSDG